MRGWREVALGEVVGRPSTWDPRTGSGSFNYIDIGSVDQQLKQVVRWQTLSPSDAPSRARQLVRVGDVLVSTVRPNLNAVAFVPPNLDGSTASTGFSVLRPDTEHVLREYLFHWLRSPRFVAQMVRRATGASYPAVSDAHVRGIRIPLPPLPEQRRIAAILDKADAVRRKRQASLALLDELLRSTFLDMFGDPVLNERGWDVVRLGEVAEVRRGASPRPIHLFMGGKVPWIKIGDATASPGMYIERTAERVTDDGAKKSVLLGPGSVVIANSGVSLGFARILGIRGCIHDGWLAVEGLDPSVNKVFFVSLVNVLMNRLRATAPAGTQPNLNIHLAREMRIPVPPMRLQDTLVRVVEQQVATRARLVASAEHIASLFHSLSQRAFQGDLPG